MKKILLTVSLGASFLLANNSLDLDLLSQATNGNMKGNQFELSKLEMKKADGGSRYLNFNWSTPPNYWNNRAAEAGSHMKTVTTSNSSTSNSRVFDRMTSTQLRKTYAASSYLSTYMRNR